jgi:hypothetical protein
VGSLTAMSERSERIIGLSAACLMTLRSEAERRHE